MWSLTIPAPSDLIESPSPPGDMLSPHLLCSLLRTHANTSCHCRLSTPMRGSFTAAAFLAVCVLPAVVLATEVAIATDFVRLLGRTSIGSAD